MRSLLVAAILSLPALASARPSAEVSGGLSYSGGNAVPGEQTQGVGLDLDARAVSGRFLAGALASMGEDAEFYGAEAGLRLARGPIAFDLLAEGGLHEMTGSHTGTAEFTGAAPTASLPYLGGRAELVIGHDHMFVSFSARLRQDVGNASVSSDYQTCAVQTSDWFCGGTILAPGPYVDNHETDRFGGLTAAFTMAAGARF